MSALFFRHAFSDFLSLRELESGKLPAAVDLRRRLFVMERRFDPARPDHFYHAYLQQRFGDARNVWEFPRLVLGAMADRFLEKRRGRHFVKKDAFFDWQNAVGALSPLALLVYAITSDPELAHVSGDDPGPRLTSLLGVSACIGPFLPALDDLIDQEGLFDTHIHLNGSTEVDIVWADAVMQPNVYLAVFRQKFGKNPVKELLDQIEPGLTARRVFKRLRAARRARHLVAGEIRRVMSGSVQEISVDNLLDVLDPDRTDAEFDITDRLSRSPYFTLFPGADLVTPLVAEAAFLFSCFDALTRRPELADLIGLMLWHNFTVFSQVARLTVQQVDQTGFHQFDKFNAAGTRDTLEHAYQARFGQLNGGAPTGDLAYLDGRFAPKDTPKKTIDLLGRIVDGLLDYRSCANRTPGSKGVVGKAPACLKGPCACPGRPDRMDVALVAHFVKSADGVSLFEDDGTLKATAHGRHLKARRALGKQYRALRHVLDHYEIARTLVRGIDGAGNELDAPPEVFAPTFRALRESGAVMGASFHVGEDFVHLASGVRAVEEAVRFLGLGPGDRVGHAVALGVEPRIWSERIGDRILMRDEDRLDDAVYTLGVLRDAGERFPDEARLQNVVEVLSYRIYDERVSLSELERSWGLRDLDILTVLLLEETFEGEPADIAAFAEHALARSDEFLDPDRRREAGRIGREAKADPRAFRLYRRRHAPEVRARGMRQGECRVLARNGTFADVSLEVLHALQTHGLKLLRKKGLVIETLPTSNVRIGAYGDHSEHHVLRWLGVDGTPTEVEPEVCLGSDDPGIFSTNARNEYAHVLLALEKHLPARTATDHLRRLNGAGRTARFSYATTARRSSSN